MSHELLLGKTVLYKDQYDPKLLHPVPRALNRAHLPLQQLPFTGVDIWNGYELSWLNGKGKPVVALGEFTVPFNSPNLIESKSFKLYLNSFNGTRFDNWQSVQQTMARDLSAAAEANVLVELKPASENLMRSQWPGDGVCLDELDVACDSYELSPALLALDQSNAKTGKTVRETLHSQLLKSNCPVTGQPDWATVVVRYHGAAIDHASLLRYIVSFRNHAEFHEHCIERMFCDIWQRCQPQSLTVFARYTRRGGLDINPYRSSDETVFDNRRAARQ
ncbi:MAG: NADPH-dependent 7-cyano-7-deazaguanine reductase QueF [Permianibacter sp.]